MKKLIKGREKLFGYVCGIAAIIIYAIINIISQTEKTADGMNVFIYALLFVIVKEFFATVTHMFSGNPLQKIKVLIDVAKHYKRSSAYAIIAGLFGGVIGFTLITAGGIYIGSALGSPIYSLETIIVMAVMYFFFKKRSAKLHIIGIFIVAIVAILIPLSSILLEGAGNSKNAWLGAGLLVLGVMSWSIESILFDKITERHPDVSVAPFLLIKQLASFVLGIVIVLPIFGAVFTSASNAYHELGTLFGKNSMVLLYAFIAGVLLYFGRLLFFISLKYVGATTANAIYSLIPFVQTPLAYIAYAINPEVDFVGNIHHETFWVFMAIMGIGVAISYLGQKSKNGKRL